MVIHIKFEKKNNINITNEEIIENMNMIDNLLKKIMKYMILLMIVY